MDRTLSFDGCGINDVDEYRTRIATFVKRDGNRETIEKYGPMFAAAPELLAACQRALPLLVEFCNLHPAMSDTEGVPRAFALGNLRAAIAKALPSPAATESA